MVRPRPPPALKRGAGAWLQVERSAAPPSVWLKSRHPEVGRVVTRAQVHAVADTTNEQYLAAVDKAFLLIEKGCRQGTWPTPQDTLDLDAILSAICDDLIYTYHAGRAAGEKLQAAWAHVFPEQMDSLPHFIRTCQAWKRIVFNNEGFGMCKERWAALATQLFESTRTWLDFEAAAWWCLQKDVSCRTEDLEQLRNTPADVAVTFMPNGDPRVALFFGVAERGETSKTSTSMPNQGVIIDNPWVAELVLTLLKRRSPGEKIFRISREQVWGRVQVACARLGIECQSWKLHRLRHTGAANDYLDGVRTLEQIQRRGRWAGPSGVQRYTKTAHLVADLADLGDVLRRKGEDFLADPRRFVRTPPAKSAHFA